MDLSVYWQLYRRRLPMVLCLTMLGSIIGVWLAMTLPAVFRAEAVLVVESGQISGALAASTVQTGDIEALEIIRQRILSRDTLLDMTNRLAIHADSPGMGDDEKVADLRNRIHIVTRGGQVGRAARDATIVTVGFSAPDAQLAASTTNQIVTLLLQTNVDMRVTAARQTLDFFVQEVARFEGELSQLSAQILSFQESNLEALPDSLEFRRSRQASLQERLVQLDRQQAALQDRRALLVTLFQTTGSTDDSRTPSRQPARPDQRSAEQRLADQRLAELRGEYASLATLLSESNPRMAMLRSQIGAAETMAASLPTPDALTGAAAPDPASLFDIQQVDLDAQIAFLDDQKAATEAQITQISRTIAATPGNAAALAVLERTFSNVHEQYNQAVANKARAQTGRTIEALAQGQRISVVQQAVPPEAPSGPNRPLVSVAGFMAGLSLALGLAVVLERLDRTIRRPEDIEKALGLAVFATLPFMTAPSEPATRPIRALRTTALLVATAGAGVWAATQALQPLAARFSSFVS